LEYRIKKIKCGPDSRITPTKAANTINVETGSVEIISARLKLWISNSTNTKGTKIQKNNRGTCFLMTCS